jgi:hypothetical protein
MNQIEMINHEYRTETFLMLAKSYNVHIESDVVLVVVSDKNQPNTFSIKSYKSLGHAIRFFNRMKREGCHVGLIGKGIIMQF